MHPTPLGHILYYTSRYLCSYPFRLQTPRRNGWLTIANRYLPLTGNPEQIRWWGQKTNIFMTAMVLTIPDGRNRYTPYTAALHRKSLLASQFPASASISPFNSHPWKYLRSICEKNRITTIGNQSGVVQIFMWSRSLFLHDSFPWRSAVAAVRFQHSASGHYLVITNCTEGFTQQLLAPSPLPASTCALSQIVRYQITPINRNY